MRSEPFILCENLVKIYRLAVEGRSLRGSLEVQALQGLDFVVSEGEMVGVVGASGSGKSTLLNILGGLDRPTGGRASVDGKDLGRMTQAELDHYRREKVGFVWQQAARNLLPYLTARENVALPLMISGRLDPIARRRPAELLRMVDLDQRAHHRLEELSGGEQQRVAIAIALANQPCLLLADEPTGELDTATAQSIYDLLRRLNKALDLTIVIVSHDTKLAERVDRVVAVRDGKLASETVRRKMTSGDKEKHHLEEMLVLDSAGRLQIPREHLERYKIRRRVQLEETRRGILIRRPEHETDAPEKSAAGAAESEVTEARAEKDGGLEGASPLQAIRRTGLNLLGKLRFPKREDRDPQENKR
jgi:ABC-type lipoprotein export system ATPase subunit/bifunctional DNA-binding transcriptional regulator/antitoxin component of YhaV-PrlF toxin-antitoxin module